MIYFSVLLVVFLFSCNRALDKEEAKELILKTGLFPNEKTEGLKLGYPMRFSVPVAAEMYKNMSGEGLLTIDTIHDKTNPDDDDIKITLTPYGQTFINTHIPDNSNSCSVFVVVGKELFHKIDSIVMKNEGMNAEVYFTTKIVALTPFGKLANYKEGMTFSYTFDFVKKEGSWEVTYYH